jgi:hypothetical protein
MQAPHSAVKMVRRALLLVVATAAAAGAQTRAALVGTVRDTAGVGVPLASISLAGVRGLSDSAGRFTLAGLPGGAGTLMVRRIGFEPINAQLELVDGRTDSLNVVLVMLAGVLPGVTTHADALERVWLSDFYRHRDVGNGVFFNRKELDAKKVVRLSDVLRRLPGLRMMTDRNGRQQLRIARGNCIPDFWVDGQRAPFLNVDDVPLGDVEALEVYRGASGIPPEFNNRFGNPGCGAIVIWTRLPG